eukprot:479965-Pleurochrysis_carterae.AAC.1
MARSDAESESPEVSDAKSHMRLDLIPVETAPDFPTLREGEYGHGPNLGKLTCRSEQGRVGSALLKPTV